jgi:hypothetical protein
VLFFLHPYKTKVMSVEDIVMNVVCSGISAVFVHSYKTYVMRVEFSVMNFLYME